MRVSTRSHTMLAPIGRTMCLAFPVVSVAILVPRAGIDPLSAWKVRQYFAGRFRHDLPPHRVRAAV